MLRINSAMLQMDNSTLHNEDVDVNGERTCSGNEN